MSNENDRDENWRKTALAAATDSSNNPAHPSYWKKAFGEEEYPDADDLHNEWVSKLLEHNLHQYPTTLDAAQSILSKRLKMRVTVIREEFQIALRRETNEEIPETHNAWAVLYSETMPEFIAAEGRFWFFDEGESNLWEEKEFDTVVVELASHLDMDGRNCTRLADYEAITRLIYQKKLTTSKGVFDNAPIGVAAGNEFLSLNKEGRVEAVPLTQEHYARFKVDCRPASLEECPVLSGFLDTTFGDDVEALQLFGEQIGAALFGIMGRMKKVAFWYGGGDSGKSTGQALIKALVPKTVVTAIAPHDWDNEYYRSFLVGKRFNMVGEISASKPLDVTFKNVTGNDSVSGRDPRGKPFTFDPQVAHFFNGNDFPPTRDRNKAFYNRWSLLHFQNSVPEKSQDRGLVRKIKEKELGGLLTLAMEGVQRVVKDMPGEQFEFSRPKSSFELMATWLLETDSITSFILESELCLLDSDEGLSALAGGVGRSAPVAQVYEAYKIYCATSRLKAIGQRKFTSELRDRVGPSFGISYDKNPHRRWVGVALAAPDFSQPSDITSAGRT